MEIIFDTNHTYTNVIILLTQKEIDKNNIKYNGKWLDGFESLRASSVNFNIQIIKTGEK